MPEEFKAQNADKNFNQGIDDFRKSKKGLDEMDEPLSIMRNNEYYDESVEKNSRNQVYSKNQKAKKLISQKEAGLLRAKEMTKKDLEKRKNETSKNQTEIRDIKNENKIDSEEATYAENRRPSYMVNPEKNSNSENQKENINPEKAIYAGDREPSHFKEKKENKEKTDIDQLQAETEEALNKLLEVEEEFQKTKNKRGIFKKAQAFFGVGENKEGHVNREFIDQKKKIKKLKEEYKTKYNNFAKQLVENKKQELKNEGNSQETIKDLIGSWILSGEAVSVKEKKEDGAEEEKKISLFEHINENEKKILEKRKEASSEKEKGSIRKSLDWYNNLSKTKKLIYGVGISSGIGMATVLGGGAAIGTVLGYGAWRGGKTLVRRVIVGASAGAAIKGVNSFLSDKEGKKNLADLEKTKDNFVGEFENENQELFKILEKYNKTQNRRKITRRVIVGGTTIGLLGTTLGLEALASGDISVDHPQDIDFEKVPISDNTSSENLSEGNIGSRKFFHKDHVDGQDALEEMKGTTKDHIDGQDAPDSKVDNSRIANKVNEDKYFKSVFEAEKLNHSFELAKGGNVWNSLSEHFDQDRPRVGRVLNQFKIDMLEDLTENHGMTHEQAEQFIEWRYRNMNAGMDFELKNGKLEIPEFDSEQKIVQFGKTEFNNPDSMNDTMENAGESRAERLNEMADKNKTVEVSEPVETVEVLDPEISAQIDQNVNNLVKDIYGRQAYEWDVMKDKNVLDVINEEYGNPIKQMPDGSGREVNEFIESERGDIADNGLDQAEINNRKELRNVLLNLTEKTGIQPNPDETVEQFIRRVEMNHYNQGVEDGVSGKATVEVPDPDSFEAPEKNDLNNDLANAPERLVGWDSLRNSESWEVLNTGDELTRNHLKDLITNSNSVPMEGESLEEFHNRALEKIDGSNRIPQTDLEESLNKVFGKWDSEKIDQWMKMREYKADVIYDRDIYSLNLTDKEHMAFSSMKAHLQELVRASGIEPDSGESLASYIEKAQKSLKI
jgi:hypothetical protein